MHAWPISDPVTSCPGSLSDLQPHWPVTHSWPEKWEELINVIFEEKWVLSLSSFLLSVGWNSVLMAGAGAAILDHKNGSEKNSRVPRQKEPRSPTHHVAAIWGLAYSYPTVVCERNFMHIFKPLVTFSLQERSPVFIILNRQWCEMLVLRVYTLELSGCITKHLHLSIISKYYLDGRSTCGPALTYQLSRKPMSGQSHAHSFTYWMLFPYGGGIE